MRQQPKIRSKRQPKLATSRLPIRHSGMPLLVGLSPDLSAVT